MTKIFFIKDIKNFKLKLEGESLCIYHKSYPLPTIPNCKYIEFSKYEKEYIRNDNLENKKSIVFVGTNKIINPSNRIKPIFEIFNGIKGFDLYSIDRVPFVCQPWRIFFHFFISGLFFDEYSYSYALQHDYERYLDNDSDINPLAIEKIINISKDYVYIDYKNFFTNIRISTVKISPEIKEQYQNLKKDLFEKEDSINRIILKLSNFAQDNCVKRNIPSVSSFFDTFLYSSSDSLLEQSLHIVKTDLKIDDYLCNNLTEISTFTNNLTNELYKNANRKI
jgi:hypothetical protein